jgi:ATP-dependent RNA helicase SUPV3L1/SUV3
MHTAGGAPLTVTIDAPEPMPDLPAAGAATLAADADPRGAGLAYRRAGPTWVRVDLADRLASHAHKVRSAGGDSPLDADLATSIGLDEQAVARLMSDIGFAKAGDSWRWRGRHASRARQPERASHAFAELAKLRRK